MSTINWGIIGCGNVTEVKSGPAFNKVPNSRLLAVMRRNGNKARDYAQRHGVQKWYDDADRLINDPEVNAIYVATPPASHEEFTLKAIAAGKPVYVEKPMSVSHMHARRMAMAASDAGVKLTVAHYRRQQPLFLKILSLLNEKAIGDVRLVNLQCFQPHNSSLIAHSEENWRINPAISGGGLFHDLAPHQLDLMLYFFGRTVKASGFSTNAAKLYEAFDTTTGQAVFGKGVQFSGSWCFTAGVKKDQCEIVGSGGAIRFSIFDHQPLVLQHNGKETVFEFDPLLHVQQPMIQKVVEYFLDAAPNPCPAAEAAEVMAIIDAFSSR